MRQYPSLCYDAQQHAMLLGCTDAIMRVKLPLPPALRPLRRPILTGMNVNGSPFLPTDRKEAPYSISYQDKITLKHSENKFTLFFSAMNFAPGGSEKYAYRLEPTQEEWMALTSGMSSVSFLNLAPGTYRFSVCTLDVTGTPPATDEVSDRIRELTIVIRPPLYASVGAWILYGMLLLGVSTYVIGSIRRRIRLRRTLFEKETLLAQSSAKISFLADISHDLKTPLSLIIGPISQMMLTVRDKTLRTRLDLVRQNAERINSLINQILNFKNLDTENDRCILSTVDLHDVFLQVIDRYREKAAMRRIETRIHTENRPLYYSCDLYQMESVLENLLSNAYKFVRNGGVVDLTLTADPTARRILIRIADNGIGIPEAEQPYIFQRFFQSSLTRNLHTGTGIGLYLVQKYVTMHSGSIRMESHEGSGTCFTIELPIPPTPESSPEPGIDLPAAPADDHRSKPRILIAEDNPELARFIAESLAEAGTPHIVANGREALAFFHREKPDLMITDLMMPEMDGMELCRRIRSAEQGQPLPIIMLTALSDAATETESLRLNIDAFISKPFDITRLVLRVRQLLSARSHHPATPPATPHPASTPAMSPDEQFLSEVTAFIENAIDSSDLNIAQIAQATGISPKQLYRRLKTLTGYTPVDYIRSIRIKRAAMMLASGRFTVSETMYSVGFSDSSYFARCFRAEFGCTPSQYRKEQEQKRS